jgi:putative ABC transport system permease protein
MKKNDIKPPRWTERFLHWYCKPELLEDLEGDLHEYFERNIKSKGIKKANLIYIIDVVKFLRPYTIRKPQFINPLMQGIMIGSYIKTSGRNMVRNKLFSAINIFGLAISMSVGLLLIGLLSDMNSYDRFHKNGERIYRVISKYKYLDQENKTYYASSSLMAGNEIKENLTGIDGVARLFNGIGGDFKSSGKTIPLEGMYADESLFDVFSFQLQQGNPATALKEPFSIIITQTTAKKLFDSEDVVGKTLLHDNKNQYTITGVVRDLPKFSHIKFEMLASLSTLEVTEKDNWEHEMRWDNMWQGYIYLLLPENADPKNIQANLDKLCEKNNPSVKNAKISLALQPLYDIALGDDLNNSLGYVMSKGEVWMIAVLTIVVILSACFNYTNLSIARAMKRSREVGIRKVIGALRVHVFGQFIVEALSISIISLVLSVILFWLLTPYFLELQPKMQNMLELNLSPKVILYFIVLAIAVGVLAGFIPALLFSKLNSIQVLKNINSVKLLSRLNLRKALIVVQYTVSLIFITATIIGYKQYHYFLNFDLGYNTKNILNIELQGNKADLIANELKKLPEVEGTSQSVLITSVGNYWTTRMKYNDPADSIHVNYNGIDENYIPLHEVKLIVGRNFIPLSDSVQESEVIVNERTLKRFNIAEGDPLKAIDEIVMINGKKMKIIGVMGDFHYGKAENNDQEVVLRYMKKNARILNVKIQTTDWNNTLAKIESSWKKLDDVHPFKAELYTDRISRSYGEIAAMVQMIGWLTFLAVCIASLGLLGMVIFITETRLKEIGIRKVLGAREAKLIYLLSKGFLSLLILSGAVALPVTYFFFDQIAFQEIANHITITTFDMLFGFGVVLTIALAMIGFQTLKIARSNPAQVLKSE